MTSLGGKVPLGEGQYMAYGRFPCPGDDPTAILTEAPLIGLNGLKVNKSKNIFKGDVK